MGLLLQAGHDLAKPVRGFTDEALACLMTYPWPGNIRELRNEIYRALALAGDLDIGADLLSARVLRGRPGLALADGAADAASLPRSGTLQSRLEAMEAAILKETLLRCRWNKTRAAKELGLSRVGLRQKLLRLGLERQAEPRS